MLRLKGALHARCAQKAISTTELEVIVCPTANLANREPTVLKRVQQIHHLAKNVFPVSTVIVLLLQQRPGVNRVALVLTVKRAEVMNVHSVAREKQGTSLELLLLLIAYYVIDIETSGGWQEGWGTLQPQCLYLTEKKHPN